MAGIPVAGIPVAGTPVAGTPVAASRTAAFRTTEYHGSRLMPTTTPAMYGHPPRPSQDLLWLLLPGFAALFLHQTGRLWPDTVMVAIWLLLTIVISCGLFLRLRIRRRAWLEGYVAAASPLHRWLRGGSIALLLCLFAAALLALILLSGLLRLQSNDELLLLLASLPLLVLLRWASTRLLATHVATVYLPEAGWRLASTVTLVLLCTALLAAAWWRPGPDLSQLSLEQAVWQLALQERAESALLEQVLALAAAIDGVGWWLAQHILPRLQWPLLELLGWLLVLLHSAVFVWAWLHLCSGTLLLRHVGSRHRAHDP